MSTAVTATMPFAGGKLARTELANSFATCLVFSRTRRGHLAYTARFRIKPFLRAWLVTCPVPGFVERALD